MKSTKETPDSSIDWRKVQLVALKEDESRILLTTGDHHDDYFDATVVYDRRKPETVGHASTSWAKEAFIVFQGTITLEND